MLSQLEVGPEEPTKRRLSPIPCSHTAIRQELWFLVDTCRVQLSRAASDKLHSHLAGSSEGLGHGVSRLGQD